MLDGKQESVEEYSGEGIEDGFDVGERGGERPGEDYAEVIGHMGTSHYIKTLEKQHVSGD